MSWRIGVIHHIWPGSCVYHLRDQLTPHLKQFVFVKQTNKNSFETLREHICKKKKSSATVAQTN